MSVTLLTELNLEFLSLKGGCRGLSESTLVKIPHCWKSYVTAEMPSSAIGAWWLNGTVLDSRSMGCGFEPHQGHCVVSLSKMLYPLLQPMKTRTDRNEKLQEIKNVKSLQIFYSFHTGVHDQLYKT